jgi:hypothetical protein
MVVLVEVSWKKLGTSQARASARFSTLIFPFYTMLFIEFSFLVLWNYFMDF